MKNDNAKSGGASPEEQAQQGALGVATGSEFIRERLKSIKETLTYFRKVGWKEEENFISGYRAALRACLEIAEADARALHSARYVLEEISPESLAEKSGLPMGVIVDAMNNIFPNNKTEQPR